MERVVVDEALAAALRGVASGTGTIVALTGAGISAESGIPTFRGKEGYWTVGSREYHPQEMATWGMFSRHPERVWPWYLYRIGICARAQPNAAHDALVRLEEAFGDRFVLVTQNVDGLHARAGNSVARTYMIHGDLNRMRCAAACSTETWAVPDFERADERATTLSDDEAARLRCPRCGEWARPHVLWFDECYDEERYRYESTLRAAQAADLLFVVGTSGATSLPMAVGQQALARGTTTIDVNPEENPFASLARRMPTGFAVRATAIAAVPPIVEALAGGQ